jgi:hypothetical protein
MELLLTTFDSNSVSDQNHEVDSFDPGGLLNSNYQSTVKITRETTSKDSLYAMKQSIKIKRFQLVSSVETLLKLTIFTAVILSIFN